MHNIISRRGNRIFKIHYVILITVTCMPIRGADDAYPTLNRTALHKKIAKYEQLSKEEKNEKLIKVVTTSYGDPLYYKKRSIIAALAHAGADIPAVQIKTASRAFTLLPDTVLMDDYELTLLLINKKANINEQGNDGETAIHKAKTFELAQLLINHHALEHLNTHQKAELINRLAWSNYSPALIPLYKKHGLNIIACGHAGYTLLMSLTSWSEQGKNTIKKAELLLEGLSIPQVKLYLAIKNNNSETVFDIINLRTSHSWSNAQALYALRDFLKQRTDPEKYPDKPQAIVSNSAEQQIPTIAGECPVCLEPINKEQCKTTPCNHIFHTYCLSTWVNQNHSCPLCRAVVK